MNPIGMPVQQAAMMYLSNPDKYWEAQAGAYKPTDTSLMLRQAGINPTSALGRQIMQQAIAKQNYIAPTSLRPGGYMYDPTTGGMQQLPNVPEGFTAVRGQNGAWQVVPVQGGMEAISSESSAKAGGRAQFQLKEVWDPTANNGQGGYVQQSVANVANAANGSSPASAPLGIRNNNPGNLRPGGNFAQFPDMQTGLQALDNNLQSYGKQGINTVAGVISKWAPPNENDTNGYIKEVSQRLGIQPNQPIDLSNPLVRQSLSTAIALRENGPSGVFGGAKPQGTAQTGPMASQPPLGQTQAANASQAAPSKQMADAYSALSAADGNYQASRAALQTMLDITNKDAPGDMVARMLPQDFATKVSNNAAEYEKAHSNFISLQGKALGAAGTDASRANQAASVPDFTKPQQARIQGLNAQLQQLDMNHLKTQVLTPLYQQGNEKAFTAQSAAFDQKVQPSMMQTITPIMQMSGPQQQSAVKAAIDKNPALRPAFEMMFNAGMLK